jgi:glycosyltransferase involved in cell wall biosynthesis
MDKVLKVTDVSLVIPVFNNKESIRELWNLINIELENFPGLESEVIFVDDGSTDESWGEIQNLPGRNRIGVKLSKNFGQLGAMKAGYSVARGKFIISISADLQDPTSLITDMIKATLEGFDLVICARASRNDGLLARFTSKVAYFFLTRDNPKIPKGGFDVFLFTKELRDQMQALKGRFNFLQGDLLYFGNEYKTIYYHRNNRKYGKSGYTFRKRWRNFQDAILDSNYTLIRFLSTFGFFVSFIGFLLGLIVFLGKILGRVSIDGYALIVCSVLFIGGIQIVLTGLLGQYIWRIYDAARDRPAFVIQKVDTIA